MLEFARLGLDAVAGGVKSSSIWVLVAQSGAESVVGGDTVFFGEKKKASTPKAYGLYSIRLKR